MFSLVMHAIVVSTVLETEKNLYVYGSVQLIVLQVDFGSHSDGFSSYWCLKFVCLVSCTSSWVDETVNPGSQLRDQ